jgi:hypothetical protein
LADEADGVAAASVAQAVQDALRINDFIFVGSPFLVTAAKSSSTWLGLVATEVSYRVACPKV